jgi:cystathionine beta-lyase/cystathionine gamma-synthase
MNIMAQGGDRSLSKIERKFETLVVHEGYDSKDPCNHGAVVPPLHTSTTFDMSQQEVGRQS